MPEMVPADGFQIRVPKDTIVPPVERGVPLRPKNVARLGGVVAQGTAVY